MTDNPAPPPCEKCLPYMEPRMDVVPAVIRAQYTGDLVVHAQRLHAEIAEARAENESAQAAWETRYSILVAALVSIAGSDTIGVHSEYIRMKAEARRALEGKP